MAASQTIMSLSDNQLDEVIKLLTPLDSKIDKRVQYAMTQFNMAKNEALEYIVTDNPILWAKVYLDWEARDYQFAILTEGKKSKKLVLRLGRRLGKCLTGDTLISDAKTGEYISIQELYKRQHANVLSLNLEKLNIEATNTNIVTDNGIKPVYKLTTTSGREITTTGNHPFYTINGFIELDDLKPGDYVSIAKNIYHTNHVVMDENHIKFLAYMIGDGTTTESSNLRFSCHPSVTKVLNEMQQICKDNDCKMFKYDSDKDCDWHIKGNQKSHREYNNNHLLTVLQDNDLIGKNAFTKTIPTNIFKLPNEQLKIFLSRLYATDGWATCSNEEKNRVEIGYCSSSKELCKGIQSLLLRFGINSILQEKKIKYNNGYNISYTLGIYSISDCKKFIENIGIFSKEDAINKVLIVINQMNDCGNKYPIDILKLVEEETIRKKRSKQSLRNYSGIRFNTKYNTISEKKLRKANELLESNKLQNILDADIIWDEIKSIEYVGEQQTYDFTVPNYHNFIANDFITHNTDDMCVLILWFAYTQYNKGPNNQYDIIIATPYETQIDLIFKRLHQLIEVSPLLGGLISRDVHHNICFNINGVTSNILGLTAGANNATGGANSTRGQRADVIILDECDYIGSNQVTNILNIRNEAPERIRLICASTPSGKHEEYYRWCIGASKKYYPTQDDIKNNRFTGYKIDEKAVGEGNGWTEIYAPSNVNKELLKINPDTLQTYLEDIRDELSEMRYVQEVMAEFGEEELGVYQKKYIYEAIKEGERLGYRYITKWSKQDREAYLKRTQGQCIRILGVDWDKYAAATNMVCMEFDRFHQDADGRIVPLFKMLFRIEIARSDFTYVNAMNKIIELNDEYKFDWIAIDRGYGEVQLEMLHKYGLEHEETGLADKVIGYQFSQKIEVTDPYTRKKDSKDLKPFMVNNSVNLFEKGKIVLDPKDKTMIQQLEEYRVKSISASGKPIYTDENEHAIDSMNLALLAFEQHHGELLKKVFSIKTIFIGTLDNRDVDVKSRTLIGDEEVEVPIGRIEAPSSTYGIIGVTNFSNHNVNKRASTYKRRTF